MVTEHQHTPGPWVVDAIDHCMVNAAIDGSEIQVCSTFFDNSVGCEEHVAHADALLIAAAPDLLAALYRCVQELRRHGFHGAEPFAEKAIAKAEGRE